MFVVASITGLERDDGARKVSKVPVVRIDFRMAPCTSASQDAHAQVSGRYRAEEQEMPLCAVIPSDTNALPPRAKG